MDADYMSNAFESSKYSILIGFLAVVLMLAFIVVVIIQAGNAIADVSIETMLVP